jgi:hypothetical protein
LLCLSYLELKKPIVYRVHDAAILEHISVNHNSFLIHVLNSNTPWQVLYTSQNDRAFITTMGFDCATFQIILASGFTHAWNTQSIPRTDTNIAGNPRSGRHSLDAAGALGLVLHWASSAMLSTSLQEIFAIIPSTDNRYIDFAIALLLEMLRSIPEVAIEWPEGDDFEINNMVIRAHHPRLLQAFGTMDVKKNGVHTTTPTRITRLSGAKGKPCGAIAQGLQKIVARLYSNKIYFFLRHVIKLAKARTPAGSRSGIPTGWAQHPLETAADEEMENATYNGWLHQHFVSSILVSNAQGE